VEEAMSRTVEEAVTPESLKSATEVLAQAMAREAAQPGSAAGSPVLELEVKHKNGSTVWVATAVTFIRDAAGKPVEILGAYRDISARTRLENELRQSERRYRLLAESVNDVIWTMDMGLRYTYISPSVERLRGFTVDEAMAQSIDEVLTPSSVALVKDQLAKALDPSLPNPPRSLTLQVESRHKSGEVIPVETSITLVVDSEKRPVGILGVTRDIRQRNEAERLLKTQRDLALKISSALDMPEMLSSSLASAIELSRMDSGGIYLFDKQTGRLELMAHQGLGAEFIKNVSSFPVDAPNVRLVTEGTPVYESYEKLREQSGIMKTGEVLRAIAVVPIHHNKIPVGCLNIASHILEDVPRPTRITLETIASQIGGGIAGWQAIEALRESERHLRSVITAAPVVLWDLDSAGTILLSEGNALAQLGLKAGELVGQSVSEIYKNDPEALALIRRGLAGEGFSAEVEVGGRHWSNHYVPRCDEKGSVLGLVGVSEDITERKRAQEELQASEEQFRATFEQAAVGIAHVTPDGRFLRVNQRFCDIVAYTREELLAKSFQEITHQDDLAKDVDSQHRLLANEIPTYSREKRYVRKDGSSVWVNLTVSLLREPTGAPKYFISVIEDITKRKQAEGALRDSEEKYRGLFDTSRDAIMTLEPPSWRFTSGNSATVRMFGAKDEEEFVSCSPWEASPDRQPDGRASAEKASEMIETAVREGSHFFEWTHRRLDGVEFPATVLLSRMESAGKVFLQATVRDISERKRVQEALQESEKRFRDLSSLASEGIMVHEGGIIQDANQAFAELIGYSSPNNLVGKNGLETIPFTPESRERLLAHMRARSTETYEIELVKPDGSILPAETCGKEISYRGRQARLVSMRDITERKRTEEKVARLSQQNILILNSAAEGILGVDLQGNHTFVNPAAARMLGYEVEELLGRPSHSTWHHTKSDGNPYPEEECEIYAAYREGVVHHASNEVFWRKDRTSFPAEYASTPICEEGRLAGAVVTFADITERVKAEQALRESEDRFRRLFRGSAEAQLLLDHEGRVVDCNDAMLRLFSIREKKDILGHGPEEFAPEFQRDGTPSRDMGKVILATVLEEGSAQLEWAHLKHDPERTPMISELICTLIAIQGRPFLHVAIRDITERKRAEEGVKLAAQEWRETFDSITDMVSIHDRDFNVMRANKAFAKNLGMKIDEIKGRKCYEVLHGMEVPWPDCPHQECMAYRESCTEELWEPRLGKYLQVSVSPLFNSRNEVVGSVHIARDITERKRAEEELQTAHAELEARVKQRTAELQEANALLLEEIRQRREAQDERQETESKYRDLVENANSIILELDTSGKISFLNRFAQDFFGFSEAETVGHHVVGTIIPPTDSEGNDLKVKIKNLTKNPEDHYAIESEGIRQDGRLVWISWTNKGLYDKKGRVRRILCIGMDRTEQRQAAAAGPTGEGEGSRGRAAAAGPRPSRRCDSDAFLSQPHRRSAAQAMGERPRRRPAPSRRTAATDSRRFG